MEETLRVQCFTGVELANYIPAVAQLRIEIFRDFPYLYDGDMAYEAKYLQTYIQSSGSVIVLVFDGEAVVGAATGVPLVHESSEVQRPFLVTGIDPRDVFYIGELVLRKAYRGRGLGVRFFNEIERHAHNIGPFKYAALCAVDRPSDHAQRPIDHLPLDNFWRKRGYKRQPQLHTMFSWREIGAATSSEKSMTFWLKNLVGASDGEQL